MPVILLDLTWVRGWAGFTACRFQWLQEWTPHSLSRAFQQPNYGMASSARPGVDQVTRILCGLGNGFDASRERGLHSVCLWGKQKVPPSLPTSPAPGESGTGISRDEYIGQVAKDIENKMPATFDLDQIRKHLGLEISPTTVVLLQELERFNKLMVRMIRSLAELQRVRTSAGGWVGGVPWARRETGA